MNDAGALEIRWTEGYLMPQESTEIVVYFHGEVNGDDDEIPEMDNKIENRSDPREWLPRSYYQQIYLYPCLL